MTSAIALTAPSATASHAPGLKTTLPPWHNQLTASFRRRGVKDGDNHPSEKLICNVIQTGTPENQKLLENIAVDASDSVTAYGVLHTLPQVDVPWDNQRKANLIRRALSSTDITIRDAGIRATEHWPCPETLAVLEQHTDPDQILADYANAVVSDVRHILALSGA